jgi:hypothetical protein
MLEAEVIAMSADKTDVEWLVRRARTEYRVAIQERGGERWRDAGYFMLPLIALNLT